MLEFDISRINSTNLKKDGYIISDLPIPILNLIVNEVYLRINNSRNISEASDYICSLSESQFRFKFIKWNRFFSFPLCLLIEGFFSSLNKFFDSNKVVISPISPNEIKNNSNLRVGDRDFFFRIVRPNQNDVSPAHYDQMFWDIMRDTDSSPEISEPYRERWKVWIPLIGCNQSNSLQVISGSHNEEVPAKFSLSTSTSYSPGSIGQVPGIDELWLKSNENRFSCPFNLNFGSFMMFHDKLVHRGPINKSTNQLPRVSCEFTLLVY